MKTAVDIGNISGEDIDKFEKFSLTPKKGEKVGAPIIEECLFNLECKVIEEHTFKNDINMFVLEGVSAHQNTTRKERRAFHAKGDGTFFVEGKHIDLRSRMTRWQEVI